MPKQNTHHSIGIAALTFQVAPSGEFRLFPSGKFRGADGRPTECDAWYIDEVIAKQLIEWLRTRSIDVVVDYEHQTLACEKNGQPAPAAGWITKGEPLSLEWREDGLWVLRPQWTEKAAGFIAAGEYKYVSPVFTYNKRTGAITGLINVALTNYPSIENQPGLIAALRTEALFQHSDNKEDSMDELVEQLRWLLDLPVGTTPAEMVSHLQKLIDQIKAIEPTATAAASFDLAGFLKTQQEGIAALRNQTPDPKQWAPATLLADTSAKLDEANVALAALRADTDARELGTLIEQGIQSGKLLPAHEGWARQVGIAALRSFMASAPVVAPVGGTQTDGKAPAASDEGAAGLSDTALAICRQLGVSPEEYAKTLAKEAAQ